MERHQSQCESAGLGAVSSSPGVAEREHRESRHATVKRLPLAALALASVSQVVCGQPAGDADARFKSCLQLDGAARGECLETIARELSSASSPAQPNGRNWVI